MAMRWHIVEVKAENPYSLSVRFADGLTGTFRLQPEQLTGVLTPLRDPDFFRQVYVDHGAATWPGEIDLAPDAMYQEIQANP